MQFLQLQSDMNFIREKMLSHYNYWQHIIHRFRDNIATKNFRFKYLKELFLEEKRFLLEALNASKKKSVKEICKKLHDIDKADGPLEKALLYYFKKLQGDYYNRFNLWRIQNFDGGLLGIPIVSKQTEDPIIKSIFKGTDVVEEEKTADKSYERRQERRRNEIAEIAASKKNTSSYKMKGMTKGKVDTTANKYVSPFRSNQSP